MRAHDALERLAAAGGPLLAEVESLVDTSEEERILGRILASDRRVAVVHRRRRTVLVLAGVAVLGAAAALASLEIGGGSPATGALSGARIELAGFHFRTPAGFEESTTSCRPTNDFNGFAAAASADGGCLDAFVMFSSRGSAIPAGADPVTVGAYQGYFVSADASQQTSLYVVLPARGGFVKWQALVLDARGLTEDQLVAVAESGLPQNPQTASTIGPT